MPLRRRLRLIRTPIPLALSEFYHARQALASDSTQAGRAQPAQDILFKGKQGPNGKTNLFS